MLPSIRNQDKRRESMNKTSTLKKVLKRIEKYRILVVLSLLMAAVTVLLTLYLPILSGQAVDLSLIHISEPTRP